MEDLTSGVLNLEKAPIMLVSFEHKFGYKELNICQRKAPGLRKCATYVAANTKGKVTNLVGSATITNL